MVNYKKAVEHLIKVDPILADIIKKTQLFQRENRSNYLISLVDSIISQQLSIQAADTIFERFEALFSGKIITAEKIIELSIRTLRKSGLSKQKILYIKDLAQKTIDSPKMFEKFNTMSDEEIIEELVKVKGIGPWTSEMFLISTMQRADVFSYGDLGIRKAIQKLYGFKKEPTKKQAEKISKPWSPYRSIACRYLWKSLEIVI